MKVIEHLDKSTEPLISYEIVPPPRGRSIKDITGIVEALLPFNPPWIDVTAHAASAYYKENSDGSIERKIYKKRPGTIGICGVIQNKFKIDTVAHILSLGFTREETEDALIELAFLGVENVLALRGDAPNYKKAVDKNRSVNRYASELVAQINELREGKYLNPINNPRSLGFCVGVAGYPEKHFEAPNLKQDLSYLKAKVDAGADYVTCQMFYDNEKYFEFVKLARESGINVPIIPGIKIITKKPQLTTIPKNFYINMPDELVNEINESPEHVKEIGTNWAIKQTEELMSKGAPCVHFYIMNDTESVVNVVRKFK